MRGPGWIALAGLAVAVSAVEARPGPVLPDAPVLRPHPSAPLRPGLRLAPRRSFGFRPFIGRRRIRPDVPPDLLPPPPPDTFIQPEGPGPSPLIEGQPGGDLPAFSHGFHLSVMVGSGQTFTRPPTLDRFIQVGQALGACFTPPVDFAWGSITLRVSFRRDGSVFGLPRVPYSDAASTNQKSELAQSLLTGLKRCTPLPLSPSLGAAVAGEIFAIRFIHEDKR